MNENITSPMIWQSKKEESLNNLENRKRVIGEYLIKEDKNKNSLINNIRNYENNLEKETFSHISLNIPLNVDNKTFLNILNSLNILNYQI